MSYQAKFKDQQWYKVRVEPGGIWDVSRDGKTVSYNCQFLVLGGEMEGHQAGWTNFVTERTKETALARFAVFDFDAKKEDLRSLEGDRSVIAGKECWAKMEIREKEGKPGSYYPARFADIMKLEDRVPGGPAHKAAIILGNTGTAAPDPAAYADNF